MTDELFLLLRVGLELSETTDIDCKCLVSLSPEQWQKLIEFAERHGVSAIVFDGYQKVFKGSEQPLDIETLMEWVGQTSYLEQRNEQQIEVLTEFCGCLAKDGCSVMLMKGQANALYYPISKHRATGDIDIYMFDTYEMGNGLAAKYGSEVDSSWYKHSQIHYKNEMFENHQYFVHTRDGKRGKLLNEAIRKSANSDNQECFLDTEILLPPVQFNAKFLTYHALAHFISEGLHLKQVLDWVMFLKKEQSNIDWNDLYAFCDKFHLGRFLDVMNDIAVHTFGIKIDNSGVTTTTPYTEKVLHSILYDEDFVFGSGEGSWHNRLHLITNMWKYRWKYSEIYQTSIFKQFYYYASGYLFHTES